jgi:hypothetical protein
MPLEDPRRDGSRRDGLRIGGWLQSLPGRRALPGRPPLVTPPPPRVPVFRPMTPREAQRRPMALPAAPFARIEDPRKVRLCIAVTCLVAAAVGGTAFVVLADRAGTAPPIAQMNVADPVTLAPMPLPTSASPSPTPSRSPSHSPSPSDSTPAHARPAPAVHRTTSPPRVIAGLRVGGTISLAVSGGSGETARHRRNSSDLLNSGFVVRSASTDGCVSLESADYPGFYLRHRDFVLHLDRSDGSAGFRQDSAFCPVPAGDGSVRLRSANYPDRYVTAYRSRLFLAEVPASRATEFAVRS